MYLYTIIKRITYLAKLLSKDEGEIKTFTERIHR